MKKYLAVALSIALLAGALSFSAFAYNTVEANALENIQEITEEYLSLAAKNTYLFENNDLDTLCVNVLPTAKVLAADAAVYNVAGTIMTLSAFSEKMDVAKDKVDYFKYVRSEQEFTVKDFKQAYTFEDVQVLGNVATVRVYEALNWQYTDYHLPTFYGTTYDVTLINDGGKWFIAEVVAPYDGFDGTYILGNTPFDLEAKKDSFDVALAAEEARIQAFEESGIDFNATKPQSRATASKGYDINTAVSYAMEYSATGSIKRNPAFIDYTESGGDCISFASQCVYAGLGGPWDRPDTSYMDKSGTAKWYWNDWAAWCSCEDFITYIESSDAALNADLIKLGPNEGFPTWMDIAGSIALVNNNKGLEYSHAIFLVDYDSPARKDVWYCAHTDEARNERMAARYLDDNMYVITPISLDN